MQDETVLQALRPCFRPPPSLPIRPFLLLLFSSLPELSLPEAEVFSSSVALSFSLSAFPAMSLPPSSSHIMSRQTPFPPSVSYHHHISAALGEENRTGEEGSPKRKREKEEKRDTTGLIPASEVTPTDGLPQNAATAAAQYLGGAFTSFCPSSPLPYSPSPCVQPSGKTQFVCSRLVVPRYLYPHLHCTSFLRGNRPPARRTKRLLGPFSCYIVVT